MAEIVNLKRTRKAKIRVAKEAKAAAARAKFGTPKALRNLNKARSEQDRRWAESHRLTRSEDRDD
jgi:Domain of unknown function (DUF4169)